MSFVADTYKRFNLSFVNGEGCYLFDSKGDKYLDFTAGIAVNCLGYNHPKFVKNLKSQLEKVLHTSNLYYIQPQEDLAEKICNISFGEKVFFCNSGAEANEAAIKLVKKYGFSKNKNKQKIISFYNSFHGRTCGALSITGQEKYRKDFGELLPDIIFVNFNDKENFEKYMSDDVCGVFVEVIQGEGGINVINQEFLEYVRKLCDKYDAILVFDEVQTGIGRTGKMFGYENFKVIPDLMTLAKALGNGIPIGALVGKEKFMNVLSAGSHASTFGGNFLASVAGKTVIEIIEEENLLDNVNKNSFYFIKGLESLKDKFNLIKKIKGIGFMIGIELDIPSIEVVNKLIEKKLLTVGAGEKIIRFVPPLITRKEHVESALDILEKSFKEF